MSFELRRVVARLRKDQDVAIAVAFSALHIRLAASLIGHNRGVAEASPLRSLALLAQSVHSRMIQFSSLPLALL